MNERVDAIRAVRTAAHDLANACSALVGGVEMAICQPSVVVLGQSTRGLTPKRLDVPAGVP